MTKHRKKVIILFPSEEKLYFNKDFHMTPAGHAAYAEAILRSPVFQQVMQMLALHSIPFDNKIENQ